MPEAPRERPEGSDVLQVLRGHVKARPRAIVDALAAKLDPGPEAESLFTADTGAGLVISQGGWWYRAEYRVVPDATGSHLEYTLLNIAGRAHRLGRFTGRKVVKEGPAAFARLLAELRAELE